MLTKHQAKVLREAAARAMDAWMVAGAARSPNQSDPIREQAASAAKAAQAQFELLLSMVIES